MTIRPGSDRRLGSRAHLAVRFGNRGFSEAQATSGDPDDPASDWHTVWMRSWSCWECGYTVVCGSGDGVVENAADDHRERAHRGLVRRRD